MTDAELALLRTIPTDEPLILKVGQAIAEEVRP